ncbi:unnamed protein product [Nezara viridula]|uniref:FAM69 protein-kinase domain-containing protein n=1 Tax=Nezara viridula TaxID=85310 RepID=A0A9P0E9B4_NEZVI|nr:unnamed protein product [Nezara viridula]
MEFALKVIPFLFILISVMCYYLFNKEVVLIDYCEHNSKNLIFNEELCNDILQGNITIDKNYFQMFINLFSTKPLFRGKFNNSSVVLKTTVSVDHVKKLENDFLRIFTNVSKDDNSLLFVQMQVHSLINIPYGSPEFSKLRLCPVNSNVERFFNKISGFSHEVHDYLQLWTILSSNPEPLIMKMLDPKVWPVPQYFGSCGQLIVVEDCGLTLTNYYDSDWDIRANLSYQLLENAVKFTFQDPDFAYYMTDISPDNIAVTREGVVKYIDLEHFILIDKNSKGSSRYYIV